jgi:hypothetical protein
MAALNITAMYLIDHTSLPYTTKLDTFAIKLKQHVLVEKGVKNGDHKTSTIRKYEKHTERSCKYLILCPNSNAVI